MTMQVVGAYLVACTLLIVIPGPNIAFLAATTLSRGRWAGAGVALGVELATLVHGMLAAVGVAALVASSPTALLVVRLAGAAYLAWMGIRTLRRPAPALNLDAPTHVPAVRSLADGFLVNLLNPKVIIFYLAFIPQFIAPEAGWPAWVQVLVLSLLTMCVGLVNSLVWIIGVGTLRSQLAGRGAQGVQRYGLATVYLVLAVIAASVHIGR